MGMGRRYQRSSARGKREEAARAGDPESALGGSWSRKTPQVIAPEGGLSPGTARRRDCVVASVP